MIELLSMIVEHNNKHNEFPTNVGNSRKEIKKNRLSI